MPTKQYKKAKFVILNSHNLCDVSACADAFINAGCIKFTVEITSERDALAGQIVYSMIVSALCPIGIDMQELILVSGLSNGKISLSPEHWRLDDATLNRIFGDVPSGEE